MWMMAGESCMGEGNGERGLCYIYYNVEGRRFFSLYFFLLLLIGPYLPLPLLTYPSPTLPRFSYLPSSSLFSPSLSSSLLLSPPLPPSPVRRFSVRRSCSATIPPPSLRGGPPPFNKGGERPALLAQAPKSALGARERIFFPRRLQTDVQLFRDSRQG